MTRQWLIEDGSFDHDYCWLPSKFTTAEIKDRANEVIKVGTGARPDAFSVLL